MPSFRQNIICFDTPAHYCYFSFFTSLFLSYFAFNYYYGINIEYYFFLVIIFIFRCHFPSAIISLIISFFDTDIFHFQPCQYHAIEIFIYFITNFSLPRQNIISFMSFSYWPPLPRQVDFATLADISLLRFRHFVIFTLIITFSSFIRRHAIISLRFLRLLHVIFRYWYCIFAIFFF